MTSNQQDSLIGVVERQAEPKKHRKSGKSAFSSIELHKRFEQHVAQAQNLFLKNDKDGAEREATMALRIHPTDHLFALLAVIAESKGQRDRASDFRLLQAFLAKDAILWEELLHEFLEEQLYYKSAVCLQRLSALETKDKTRYRTLQLQLADLYIGLGEVKRAANILIPLWNGSRCRDFEVFALLSSLFFQLGRWNSLHRLIESSIKSAFRPSTVVESEKKKIDLSNSDTTLIGNNSITNDEGNLTISTKKRRTSKRVRFFGDDDDDENTVEREGEEDKQEQQQNNNNNTNANSTQIADNNNDNKTIDDNLSKVKDEEWEKEEDEFDFSNLTGIGNSESGSGNISKTADTSTSKIVNSLYGDTIELKTTISKRNFLTLVNVHSELLNEEGHFLDTVRLIEYTAGCLQVPLLELPPDLLVRLGVAYAFLGNFEQQCREVFHHLIDTCPMAEYGDVLYDAANALQQVGMHTEARMLFQTLRRYHEFRISSEINNDENDKEEIEEVKTVFAATLFAEGQCEASLGNMNIAYEDFIRVLEIDPKHLQARLALGRMYMYEMKDTNKAVEVLTPREDEQPLERIQLGAELVRVFSRAEKYVEAIALGVSIFELILSGEDDGDTESVAPGSSRRSTATLSMPTLSRASSAIIPPSAISDIVHGPRLSSIGASSSVGRLSHALATSIKASSAVFRSNLARRGNTPLTNSIYGASAAASTAAGWARADEEERLKDSSTIFRFHRRNKPSKRAREIKNKLKDDTNNNNSEENKKEQDDNNDEDEEVVKRRRRIEEVTRIGPDSFWKDENENNTNTIGIKDEKTEEELNNNNNNNNNNTAEEQQIKRETSGERDLADLESALLEGGEVEGYNTEQYELPSLEDVSKQFTDPTMQKLFIQASSNETSNAPINPWEPEPINPINANLLNVDSAFNINETGGFGTTTSVQPTLRVTIRDALGILGRTGFIELAVTVIDCYSAIGKFTEAKEFAFVVLTRCPRTNMFRHFAVLERPLRWAVLRAALASKESEDAYRVGIRLLQEQCSEEEKNRVIELLFGVLNRVEDSNSILLRLVADRNQVDPPMLVLLGNRYFLRRSYIHAINLYLAALQKRPNDIFLCFLVGLSYLFISHQKKIRARDSCMIAGWHYLSKYQESMRAISTQRQGEAVYNCARALQYLGLHHLAVPLYEQVAYEYSIPEQCTLALKRAARWNLYFIYRWRTGNNTLALSALQSK